MNSFRSKEDHVIRISKSVFVTNFPDSFGSRDLWSLCEEYGKVVDVFIPNRKSKAGKRFAFVRFIRVDDMDRLIGNLCTLWVGRLHLQANAVRYKRPPKYSPSVKLPSVTSYAPFTSSPSGSFVDAMKYIKNVPPHSSLVSCSPALVLDDTCVSVLDVSRQVMGRTKDVNSIPNLHTILTNKGFMDVKLSYLGGLWELKLASQEFVCNERTMWVDIERIPLHLWSSSTFSRIGMKWGTVMDIEESPGSSFARKRLCIKTSMAVNILETFKVIYKGKVFMVRAKELFTRSPYFLEYKDPGYLSEDESSLDGNNNLGNSQQGNVNQVEESDVEDVPDTIFEVNPRAPHVDVHEVNEKVNSHHSDDPFGLYDLLRKPTNLSASKEDPSLSHPSRFTLVASHQDPIHSNLAHLEVNQDEPPIAKGSSSKSYPKAGVMIWKGAQKISNKSSGKILSLNVQGLGHKTKKDWVKELNSKHGVNFLALQETKIESISHMDVKSVWGNSNYQFVVSGSIGNSGGILCVWEETIFMKVDVSISDNFIALYGIWLSTNSKILIVTIVLGDFNEVRSEDERFGSIFHQSYAREFNHFISSSGLLEVKMEGYSFTWSHSSASKMSKLDRFLVSEETSNLVIIDKNLDKGMVSDELLAKRMDLSRKLHHLKQMELKDAAQKAKVNWAIEGDENSKFFHGVINKRHSQLAIRGVFVNGDWYTDPSMVKEAFLDHFTARFKQPSCGRLKLNMSFPNGLSSDQVSDLDKDISIDEIHKAVWDCGESKSPGPDGFTFAFFRRYWHFIGPDFCTAVNCFFDKEFCDEKLPTIIPLNKFKFIIIPSELPTISSVEVEIVFPAAVPQQHRFQPWLKHSGIGGNRQLPAAVI
nr:RNA-directed DNA polymerase, eukaryota [Tanacetum cinerariifolium]